MRSLILLFIFISTIPVYGQRPDELRNKNHYLYYSDIPLRNAAKMILADSIQPSDNQITFSCLDSMSSHKKEVRDFYFPVCQKIIQKADGALAEVIGSYVLYHVSQYPQEFAGRYICCSSGSESSCCKQLERLGSYAGTETMMAQNPKKTYEELTRQMSLHYRDWKSDKVLMKFINAVDEAMRDY